MEEEAQKELQLLPSQHTSSSSLTSSRAPQLYHHHHQGQFEGSTSSLDLQLSISLGPIQAGPICDFSVDAKNQEGGGCVEELKWQAAEQIRLAAMEKAYAERVRELTRREMELAESEFARARHMWQRAREEVEKAERMKERATSQIDSTCMEITCHSCRQRFKP